MIVTRSVSWGNNSATASLSPEHIHVLPFISYVSFEKYLGTEKGHLLNRHPSLSNGSGVFQSSGQVTLVWS